MDIIKAITELEFKINKLKESLKILPKSSVLYKDIKKDIDKYNDELVNFNLNKKLLDKRVNEQKKIIDNLDGNFKEKNYTKETIATKIIEKNTILNKLDSELKDKNIKKAKKTIKTLNNKFKYHELQLNPLTNQIEAVIVNKEWKTISEKANEFKGLFDESRKELFDKLNIQNIKNTGENVTTQSIINDLDKKVFKSLDNKSSKFLENEIPDYGKKGVNFANIDLKKSTYQKSKDLRNELTNLDERVIKRLLNESMDDIALRTKQTSSQVKSFIRKTSEDTFRKQSLTGGNYWDIYDNLLEKFKTKNFNFIDSSGRKWKADTYAKMLTRTKLRDVQEETYQNSLVNVGADLIVVDNNGELTCQFCTPYNKKILSITGKTRGIETVANARNKGKLFHPNCDCTTHLFDVSGLALDYGVSESHIVKLARDLKTETKVIQALIAEEEGPLPF